MILSVFIVVFILSITLLLIGYFKNSTIVLCLSLLFLIMSFAGSVTLEIPYEFKATSDDSVVLGTHYYQDLGLNILILGAIFINIILIIAQFIMNSQNKKYDKFLP